MADQEGHDALEELYWRSEILQALYWMHGEGIATEADAATLARFLGAGPGEVTVHLERLTAQGYLERTAAGDADRSGPAASEMPVERSAPGGFVAYRLPEGIRYRLTELGTTEGARSFQDDFAELTRPGHGECSVDCWCHDPRHANDPCPTHPEASRGR